MVMYMNCGHHLDLKHRLPWSCIVRWQTDSGGY